VLPTPSRDKSTENAEEVEVVLARLASQSEDTRTLLRRYHCRDFELEFKELPPNLGVFFSVASKLRPAPAVV